MNIEHFQVTAILHSFMLHFRILAFWGNYVFVFPWESSTASSAQQVCWHWLPSNMAPWPEKFESMLIEVWDGKPLTTFLLMFTLFWRFQVLIIIHKCCECRGKPTPRKAVKRQFGSLYYDIPLGISSIEWGGPYTPKTLNFMQVGLGIWCSFVWIHDSIVRGLCKKMRSTICFLIL